MVVLAFPSVACAGETSLASVLSDPARFDEQRVTVRGTLTDLKAQRSRKGNRFYSFTLSDGGHAVPIVVSKRPGCPAGSFVSVEGTGKHLWTGPGHTAVRIEAPEPRQGSSSFPRA